MESTLISMRPELWEAYRKIREKYREEGWGIYDDTADMDRAVVLSDAYYGDGSSVVWLYQKTGKPVMVQNVFSLHRESISLAMYNMVEYKGEWWFFAFKDSCIYRMDKNTFEINRIVKIPLDKSTNGIMPQYGKIYICDEKVFLMPWFTNRIVVYDINQKEIRYIEYGQKSNRGEVFWDGVRLGNYLILIPCAYEYILKIDLTTEKIFYIELEMGRNIPKEKRNYAWGSIYIDKSKIYFTNLLDNKIIQVELEDDSQQVYECRYLENGGAGICGDEKAVWIIPLKTEKILCWDRKKKELRIYDAFPEGYEAGDWSFGRVALCNRHLYLLPRDANMCIAVNTENGGMRNLVFEGRENDSKDFYSKYMRFSSIWENGENIYIMNTNSGKAYCVNDCTLQIEAEKEIKLLSNNENNLEMDFILSETGVGENEA